MSTNSKLVSIITAMYNAEKYIETTIQSVIAQDYKNWEMIIVDDQSCDASFSLAEKYINADKRIQLLRMSEKSTNGPASVRNTGLKIAKGEIITFIDSDDLWESNFLSAQLEFMDKTNCPFVYASYKRLTEKSNDIYIVKAKSTYKSILKSSPISCLTAIYDREKLGLVLMPVEALKREDFGCFLALLKKTPFALGNQAVLATYRIHNNSYSSGKFKMAKYQYNVYRKVAKINFFSSIYYLICWAILGLIKYKGVKR